MYCLFLLLSSEAWRLRSVGIPTASIALIIGVDRILDMSRTAVNVTGDLNATLVMNRLISGNKTLDEERQDAEKLNGMEDNVICEE